MRFKSKQSGYYSYANKLFIYAKLILSKDYFYYYSGVPSIVLQTLL